MARPIDTSVIVGLERRGHPANALPVEVLGESGFLAAISVSELLVGVHRAVPEARRKQREAFVDGVLLRLPVLPLDIVLARVHARLLVDLAAAGQTIGANDLLIAATALAFDYPIPTDNVRDFNRVPGLVVTRPAW